MITTLLNPLTTGLTSFRLVGVWALTLTIAVFVSYNWGKHTGRKDEKAHWQNAVMVVERQAKEQKEKFDEQTRSITMAYSSEISSLRNRLGSPRTDLSAVRVYSPTTCPREGDAPREASGVTQATTSTTPEVVTQEEFERINNVRFEENRIQLESLIRWVTDLYRTYGTQ